MSQPTEQRSYLVVGTKSWNRRLFDEVISKNSGHWTFFSRREELTGEALRTLRPAYVFFLHWSWLVPKEIVAAYECVCFHMTAVPYGRGGSPLQNLILRGHRETKLTALRMTDEIDAGPVYCQADLSLAGTAAEILARASVLSADMIRRMIEARIAPTPQTGEPVIFRRRTPAESEIAAVDSIEQLYDFIRMLDGEGYPPAFINYRGFHFEFTGAKLHEDAVITETRITRLQNVS